MTSNKKIRILQAIRQGMVGGGETHVLDLVNHLDTAKFESIILAFTPGPMVDELQKAGFKVYIIHTEKPFNWMIWPQVAKILNDEKIDLVHAHGTRANSNVFRSANKLGIPVVYTVHGWSFHPDQSFIVKFLRTISERFLVSNAKYTICVSHSNMAEGTKHFPITNGGVIVNGINQIKFDPQLSFLNFRKEIGFSDDAVVVGYIARITAQKDPFTFLKAISLTEYDMKFIIIGDGELKKDMLCLADDLKIRNKIVFLDFRKDIPAILKSIDIFCLPSLWEGLPIALLEAMAMGKAIVATEIDGTRDLIINNKNGLLVPVSEPEKLAQALDRLAGNKVLREKFGFDAYRTVKENFGISEMTLKVQNVYLKNLNSDE